MIQTKFQNDKTEDGWKLLKDVRKVKIFSANELELFSFLKEGEDGISGKELIKRAKKNNANLGQLQAEHLLEHERGVPEEWRQFDEIFHLVFPGTIWHDGSGNRVLSLRWDGERWCLDFDYLAYPSSQIVRHAFDSHDRLLRPRE